MDIGETEPKDMANSIIRTSVNDVDAATLHGPQDWRLEIEQSVDHMEAVLNNALGWQSESMELIKRLMTKQLVLIESVLSVDEQSKAQGPCQQPSDLV